MKKAKYADEGLPTSVNNAFEDIDYRLRVLEAATTKETKEFTFEEAFKTIKDILVLNQHKHSVEKMQDFCITKFKRFGWKDFSIHFESYKANTSNNINYKWYITNLGKTKMFHWYPSINFFSDLYDKEEPTTKEQPSNFEKLYNNFKSDILKLNCMESYMQNMPEVWVDGDLIKIKYERRYDIATNSNIYDIFFSDKCGNSKYFSYNKLANTFSKLKDVKIGEDDESTSFISKQWINARWKDVDGNTAEIEKLKSEIEKLKEENKQLNSSYSKFVGEALGVPTFQKIKELETEIKRLELCNASCDHEICQTNSMLNKFVAENTQLKGQLENKTKLIKSKNIEINDFMNSDTKLRQKIKELENTINSLEKQNSTMQKDFVNVFNEKIELENVNKNLKTEFKNCVILQPSPTTQLPFNIVKAENKNICFILDKNEQPTPLKGEFIVKKMMLGNCGSDVITKYFIDEYSYEGLKRFEKSLELDPFATGYHIYTNGDSIVKSVVSYCDIKNWIKELLSARKCL